MTIRYVVNMATGSSVELVPSCQPRNIIGYVLLTLLLYPKIPRGFLTVAFLRKLKIYLRFSKVELNYYTVWFQIYERNFRCLGRFRLFTELCKINISSLVLYLSCPSTIPTHTLNYRAAKYTRFRCSHSAYNFYGDKWNKKNAYSYCYTSIITLLF